MAVQHAGQVQNQLLLEEHDGVNNAKRVSIVAGAAGQATITMQGLVTLAPSPNFIGIVTAVPGSTMTVTPVGLLTLAPSSNFIGLVTVAGIGTLTLSDPKGFIGLVTVGGMSDPKAYVGLMTGTLGVGDRFIGLVTNVQAGLVTLAPSPNFIGLVTVANTVLVKQLSTTAVTAAVSAATISTTLLAANALRIAGSLYNDSSAICYIKFGSGAAIASFKVPLAANTYYEIPGGYNGIITGIWASVAGSMRVSEET